MNDYNVIVGCDVTPKKASFWFLADLSGAGTLIKLIEARFERFGKIPVYNNGILFPPRKHFPVLSLLQLRGDAA